MNGVVIKKTYWASLSGGKDSLFMFFHILNNLDKYPLDGVVHFELEVDYPWVKNVIDYMEIKCNSLHIPFLRIKPRKTWLDLYNRYNYPSRLGRWCNSDYKLDCKKQLIEIMKKQNKKVIFYIGYCADEEKRFKNDENIYPLAELGIFENTILEWAKTKPIFNDYYKICDRQGCMMCPMATKKELAYTFIKYPDIFNKFMDLAEKSEKEKGYIVFGNKEKYNVEYQRNIIKNKWVKKIRPLLESESI